MCEALGELREALGRYAAGFDAGTLSATDARTVVGHAAAIEGMAATLTTLAAARGASDRAARRDGQRSAAHELARATGTSVTSAREALEVGRRLADQPGVDEAARTGSLSGAQVSLITQAAAADPTTEQGLLAQAAGGSLGELRQRCAEVKAAARPDPEARRAEIRACRRLGAWTDTEGVWQLRGHGNPEDGAQVMAALAPITDGLFDQARRQGRREPPEAYAFDALVALAMDASTAETADGEATIAAAAGGEAPAGAVDGPEPGSTRASATRRRRGAPATILCRLDWDAFLAGAARDGEVCELVGYGPVAMSVVHELLETANPFIAAVLTRAKAVVGVAHLGRRPTAHQRSALQWLYPSCAVAGCAEQARLEGDHRLDWAKTHFTAVDVMDRLCRFHHGLKTNEGWALVEGTGKRAFVPPDDPRHTERRRAPPRAS